jgi:hypothetical protein
MMVQVGSIVHYRMLWSGECRAAIVTRVQDARNGIVDLSVFHLPQDKNEVPGWGTYLGVAMSYPLDDRPGRWHRKWELHEEGCTS